MAGLRYALLGGGAYVILHYSPVSVTAALLGLFVAVAAVIVEICFELAYARNAEPSGSRALQRVPRWSGQWHSGRSGRDRRKPARKPWANFVVMELLVALIIVILFAMLRPRLSADNPGKLQHTFELIYNFLHARVRGAGGARRPEVHRLFRHALHFHPVHEPDRRSARVWNRPPCRRPSRWDAPPRRSSTTTSMGIRANGVGKYLAHFAGPDACCSRR